MNWSWAVTVKLNALPAVGDAEEIRRWVAAGLTKIAGELPVVELVTVSVAVMVWLPAVLSVAVNVRVPLESDELTGRVADPSLEVKWTVPG